MPSIQTLLADVARARQEFISSAHGLTPEQSAYKPAPESWCIIEIAEHMFWAEFNGILGMWKAFEAYQSGRPIFTGEKVHHGLSIEDIISKTWKEKENVPEIAKPRLGGPIEFWTISLQSLQPLLAGFANALKEEDLEMIIYPHIISGPLNIRQRFEFLRFHLNRHQNQIEKIKAHPGFPHNH